MKIKKSILLTVAASLAAVSASHAALTLTFTNSSGTFSEGTYTVGSLDDGTPTESGGDLTARTTPSGSLEGVDNTDSFTFTYDTFAASSLSGSDLSLTNVSASLLASNANGIASADGDINATTGRGIFFLFDLSQFAADTDLRITGATATGTGNLQFVVASDPTIVTDDYAFTDATATTLGGLSSSSLSVDVTSGDYLVIRNVGASGNSFRLTSLTIEALPIPEPSTALLGALGFLALLRRRRA